MLITILYALTIVASLVLVHLSNMTKKEAYLSMFFDLSCMLIMYLGDKQHIAYILACIAALLVIFFIILYFEVIKPSGSIESLRTLISQKKKKKNPWGGESDFDMCNNYHSLQFSHDYVNPLGSISSY